MVDKSKCNDLWRQIDRIKLKRLDRVSKSKKRGLDRSQAANRGIHSALASCQKEAIDDFHRKKMIFLINRRQIVKEKKLEYLKRNQQLRQQYIANNIMVKHIRVYFIYKIIYRRYAM